MAPGQRLSFPLPLGSPLGEPREVIWAAIGTAVLLAGTGAWPPPPEAFDRPADFYSDPANQPDDPDFRARCLNPLLSFTPDCVLGLPEEERALGIGVSVDRVWSVTRGRASIALLGAGAPLDDPETAPQVWLNPGELPVPDRPGTSGHDANGDGHFDVRDYTTATGTTPPTLERVADRGLLARADRGDINGNGILDPADLLALFGQDGVDEDENGFVDDVVGWDFVDGDNDPSGTGPAEARDARRLVATANDGVGTVGVCPGCRLILLRVSTASRVDPVRAARGSAALVYAKAAGARVAALLADAEYAPRARSDVLLVQPEPQSAFASPMHDGVLVVEALRREPLTGPLDTVFARLADDVTSPLGAPLYEDWRTPVLLTAGGAALLASLPEAPTDGELLASSLLSGATSFRGVRRLNLAASLRRIRSGALAARFQSPRPLAVLNPDRPTEVGFQGQAMRLEVDWGPRSRPPRRVELMTELGRVVIDPSGRFADPLNPPRAAEEAVVMLRLLDAEGALLDERPLFFQRAPSLLPDFPVELNQGVQAPPRIDGEGQIWLATTGGRLLRVSPRGEVQAFEDPGPSAGGAGPGSIRAPLSFDAEGRPWMADENGRAWRLEGETLQGVLDAGPDPGPVVQLRRAGDTEIWIRSEGRLTGGRPPGEIAMLPGTGPISAFRDEVYISTEQGVVRLTPSQGDLRSLFGGGRVDWLVTGLDGELGLALSTPPGLDGGFRTELLRFDLASGSAETLELAPLRPAGAFAVTSVDRSGGLDVVGVAVAGDVPAPLLYAFDLRRDEMVEGFPVPIPWEPEAPVFPLDLDGDARAELIHAAQPFGLMAIGRAGTEVPSFPRITGDRVPMSPAAGDVDGDGAADLVAVTRSGRLFAWRGQGVPPTQWTGAHRDDGATLDLRNGLTGQPRPEGGCRSAPTLPVLGLILAVARRRRS